MDHLARFDPVRTRKVCNFSTMSVMESLEDSQSKGNIENSSKVYFARYFGFFMGVNFVSEKEPANIQSPRSKKLGH